MKMEEKPVLPKDHISFFKRISFIFWVTLIPGGLIYCLFRERSLFYIGSSNFILPQLAVYNLPDGLWVFSFSYSIFIIWDDERSISKTLWYLTPLLISIAMEYFQKHIIPGTYDIKDIYWIISGYLLSLVIQLNKKQINMKTLKKVMDLSVEKGEKIYGGSSQQLCKCSGCSCAKDDKEDNAKKDLKKFEGKAKG